MLRVFAPFVFLLLALVIQLSLDANSKRCAPVRRTQLLVVSMVVVM